MLSEILKKSMPVYELQLPSKSKRVIYRPMSVKEEKNLLLAQNENTLSTIALAIRNILQACFENIGNAEELELIDAQKAFIHLRAKSMGEQFTFQMKCPFTNDNLTLSCGLDDFVEKINPERKNNIQINDEIAIVLTNPTLSYFMNKTDNEDSIKELFIHCFKELHTKSMVISKQDTNVQEIESFFDSLTVSQYEKVVEYFKTTPKMEVTVKYKTKDGVQREVMFNGLDSFFELASVI